MIEVINLVLKKLLEKDKELLENNIHEQSISHRIACYLENEIKDFLEKNSYSIDVEYNKIWKDPKEFKEIMWEWEWIEYKVIKKKWKKICEFWKVFLNVNNYCFWLIEEWQSVFIWKIKKDKTIEIQSKWIRPDIIIHRRWENNEDDNFCVIEIKKWELSNEDILKLKWFTNKKFNFWYKYWIWISDLNWKNFNFNFYENWKRNN